MKSMLDEALDLAGRGFRVFPLHAVTEDGCGCSRRNCADAGKHPAVRAWQEVATRDESTIRSWWKRWPEGGIGLPTGPFAVVDVDPRSGGESSEERLSSLLDAGVVAQTGGGGRHYYFEGDSAVRNRQGVLPGIDVRGWGGFVVAAPSAHASGGHYAWSFEGRVADLPKMPPGLLNAVVVKDRVVHNGVTVPVEDDAPSGPAGLLEAVCSGWPVSAYVGKTLTNVCAELAVAAEGRNPMLNRAAWTLASFVAGGELPSALARHMLWSAALASAHLGPEPGDVWLDQMGGRDKMLDTFRRGWLAGLSCPRTVPRDMSAPLDAGSEKILADVLLEQLRAEGPVVHTEGQWRRYASVTGSWDVVEDHRVECRVQDFDGVSVRRPTTDNPDATCRLNVGANMVRGVVKLASTRVTSPDFFAADPVVGVACASGFIRVDAGGATLEPHSPDHRIRHRADWHWRPDADRTAWETFLTEVLDPEVSLVCQEFVGACLVGIACDFEKVLLMTGGGGNGKGVFAAGVKGIFPPKSVASVRPQLFDDDNHLARLVGAVVNIVGEMPPSELKGTSTFKGAVSGETLSVSPKYERAFDVTPRCGHLLSTNELHGTRDHSDGYWRRYLVAPFTKKVTNPDVTLKAKMAREADAIAAWAVEGASRLIRQGGYTEATAAVEVLAEWRKESDQVATWLEEEYVEHESLKTTDWPTASDIYAKYDAWASLTGHGQMSQTRFGRRLKRLCKWAKYGSVHYAIQRKPNKVKKA